jgi:aspartyl-tRNA(Asn)/glutamyl-tRNA(Gln) amidotransferase subunit C
MYVNNERGEIMKITGKDVEHVAMLARLAITEDEKELFTEQLNVILEYVDQLNALDTENIVPTSHVIPMQNVMREDEVTPSLPQSEILKNAPEKQDQYFKVPKIV